MIPRWISASGSGSLWVSFFERATGKLSLYGRISEYSRAVIRCEIEEIATCNTLREEISFKYGIPVPPNCMISQIARPPPNNQCCKAVRYRPPPCFGSTSQSQCPQCTRCSLVPDEKCPSAGRATVRSVRSESYGAANGTITTEYCTQVLLTRLNAHRRVWMALSATLFSSEPSNV